MRFKKCSVSDCIRNSHRDENGKLDFCSMHYQRVKKHGNPMHVHKTPSPATDWLDVHISYNSDQCLKWPFATNKSGYGVVHRKGGGKLTIAANYMCELAHGRCPSPKHECAHSCGKGHEGCVNPTHLRWATPQENQNERAVHGTSNRGARQWRSVLTEDDVSTIRQLAKSQTQTKIALTYDVCISHISNIVNRKKWSWLP